MEQGFTMSLALALYDFLPCILYAIALFYLLKFTKRNTNILFMYLMLIGAVIVEIGALSKVIWKLLNAIAYINVIELSDNALYYIGTGTVLIFISVIALSIVARKALAFHNSRMYSLPFFVPTIIILTLSTCGYLILLIMIAFSKRARVSVYMFSFYLVLSLVMAAFAPNGSDMIVHWISESINVAGTLAFAIGTYALDKKDKAAKGLKV